MSVIRWESPPEAPPMLPSRRPRATTKWQAISLQLRAKPGRWAVVASFKPAIDTSVERNIARAAATARNLTHGLYNGMDPECFQACWRRVGDEVCVYARYIGEES